jgi:biotin carboxylase
MIAIDRLILKFFFSDLQYINVTQANGEVSLPQDLYRKAMVTTVEEGLEACKSIGFPVMIKASEV